MRVAAAIFIAAHGIGHVIWFMSTWRQTALGSEGMSELKTRRSYFMVDPRGPAGRTLGILSLLAAVGFLASAWGIVVEASWWPYTLVGSATISIPVVVGMWNPVGTVSARAFLADLLLLAATFMPWGEKVLGAH
jgi:hypothetical protein